MKHLRKSGRTTRLIEEAKRLSLEGRAVYIIADNTLHARTIRILLGEGFRGIKVETPVSLPTFDWRFMRCKSAHPNCVFLVDHHAIEDRYADILEMLHRFDPPEPEFDGALKEFKNKTLAEPWERKP